MFDFLPPISYILGDDSCATFKTHWLHRIIIQETKQKYPSLTELGSNRMKQPFANLVYSR